MLTQPREDTRQILLDEVGRDTNDAQSVALEDRSRSQIGLAAICVNATVDLDHPPLFGAGDATSLASRRFPT